MAGVLGVIIRLRNPLELRFVIHQNPDLICILEPGTCRSIPPGAGLTAQSLPKGGPLR